LVTPDDFEDFNNEADLEGLFKLLWKPQKVMVGVGNAAVLTEAAAYVIPVIRGHVATLKRGATLQGISPNIVDFNKC
jgi:hypothetical protein